MDTLAIAGSAATTLRSTAVNGISYDQTYDAINAAARDIAARALVESGGRTTYSWEGNGIRLTYKGDVVNPDGTTGFGETERVYLVDGQWRDSAPMPSQSGTGLLNLQLDHVAGATDPVIVAKRELAFLLMDPALDLVGFVMRTTTSWHALMKEPYKLRSALSIRLSEITEQLALSNPGAGLNLRDIANGTNIVGYMVKALDGAIFNTMRRIVAAESKHMTTMDRDAHSEDDGVRILAPELAPEAMPQSAESEVISGNADINAARVLESFAVEQDMVRDARAAGVKVRARRKAEKAAAMSRVFLSQTGLPSLALPNAETREAMIQTLDDEQAARTAAAEKAAEERTDAEKALLAQPELAYASFLAWHHLINGESAPGEELIAEEWLDIWEKYGVDDTETMLMLLSGGREHRITQVVAGLLRPTEKLNASAKQRMTAVATAAVPADAADVDRAVFEKMLPALIESYDQFRQDATRANTDAWELAADAVIMHPFAPTDLTEKLADSFEEAIYSLGIAAE